MMQATKRSRVVFHVTGGVLAMLWLTSCKSCEPQGGGGCEEPTACTADPHSAKASDQRFWNIALPNKDAQRVVAPKGAVVLWPYSTPSAISCSGDPLPGQPSLSQDDFVFNLGTTGKAGGKTCLLVAYNNHRWWADSSQVNTVGSATAAAWLVKQLNDATTGSMVSTVDVDTTPPTASAPFPGWLYFMQNQPGPIPPPPTPNTAILNDVFNVLTIASFGIPDYGVFVAAGMAGASAAVRAAASPNQKPSDAITPLEAAVNGIAQEVDKQTSIIEYWITSESMQREVDKVNQARKNFAETVSSVGGGGGITSGTSLTDLLGAICGSGDSNQCNRDPIDAQVGDLYQVWTAVTNLQNPTGPQSSMVNGRLSNLAVVPVDGRYVSAPWWSYAVSMYLQLGKTALLAKAYPAYLNVPVTVAKATPFWDGRLPDAQGDCSADQFSKGSKLGGLADACAAIIADADSCEGTSPTAPCAAWNRTVGTCIPVSCVLKAGQAATTLYVRNKAPNVSLKSDAAPELVATFTTKTTKQLLAEATKYGYGGAVQKIHRRLIQELAGAQGLGNTPFDHETAGFINYANHLIHGARVALARRFQSVKSCESFPSAGTTTQCSSTTVVSSGEGGASSDTDKYTFKAVGSYYKDTLLLADTKNQSGGPFFATSGQSKTGRLNEWGDYWYGKWIDSSAHTPSDFSSAGSSTTYSCSPNPPNIKVTKEQWSSVVSSYAYGQGWAANGDFGGCGSGWSCSKTSAWCEADLMSWMTHYVGNNYRSAYNYDQIVGPRRCKLDAKGDCVLGTFELMSPTSKIDRARNPAASGNLELLQRRMVCMLRNLCQVYPKPDEVSVYCNPILTQPQSVASFDLDQGPTACTDNTW